MAQKTKGQSIGVRQVCTKEDFDGALRDAEGKLVVVDFYATWCGPCKMISPKLEAMAKEFTDVVFLKVDVDENAEVAEECGISAMPTFHLFKNEQKVGEVVGANEAKIRSAIEDHK